NETLKKGDVIAIEPFVTNGRGAVKGSVSSGIYELKEAKPVRMYKEILKHIVETYKTLPFSERELQKKFSPLKTKLALSSFVKADILYDHQVLLEEKGSHVAQFEHTIIIDDKPIILG
ncbi:MAG: type II methionyl aminopeptidase, partial [Candidatus Nanoarchaeia archaeon]|nr:type II methionyl aminopeptidase [Candidatus Nanoarchaeia archaeon]